MEDMVKVFDVEMEVSKYETLITQIKKDWEQIPAIAQWLYGNYRAFEHNRLYDAVYGKN